MISIDHLYYLIKFPQKITTLISMIKISTFSDTIKVYLPHLGIILLIIVFIIVLYALYLNLFHLNLVLRMIHQAVLYFYALIITFI